MSAEMMLAHLGEMAAADKLRNAYEDVLTVGDKAELTRDLGGTNGTMGFAEAVIRRF